MYKKNRVPFNTLVGEIIVSVDGLQQYSEEVRFYTQSGKRFTMDHDQCCCEQVQLEEFVGDEDDVLNTPVLQAEESTSDEQFEGKPERPDSITWTFYRITTAKGQLVLRWLGESNGYYGEEVDFSVENV